MHSPKLAILLGHSHIGALTGAINHRDRTLPSASGPLHFAMYEAWNFQGNPPYVVHADQGRDRFNPAILAAVDALAAAHGEPTFVTMFGGNEHTVLALVRHRRPFDFILPEAPDLPCTPGVELVPCAYVERILKSLMEPYLYQLYLLRQAVPGPILALEPPPVNGDNSYLESRLDAFFLANSDIREISPSPLRRKMRLLQRRLLKTICDDNQVTMLPPPAAALTPDGFLDPSCYGPDATHAGGRYGELLLRQVEASTGGTLRTWSTFS